MTLKVGVSLMRQPSGSQSSELCLSPLELTWAHSTHSLSLLSLQRIAASELAPGLQHFGCSIHGQLDLNEDGLVDLAVGALGNAVVLWFVPLLSTTRGLP